MTSSSVTEDGRLAGARPIHVLLVEDDLEDAERTEEMLRHACPLACRIERVPTLAEARRTLSRDDVDVVLLDLALPDAFGLDGLTRLAAEQPQLPVVVLSSTSSEALALRAVQIGAQDYLVKGAGDGAMIARAIRYAIERKKAEEKLAYYARHDPLTGLVNTRVFREHLRLALARSDREGHMVAVLFLDLDHFKQVNDSLGHEAGDIVLRQVADRLLACTRETDVAGRLGGDEFALLLEGLSRREDASAVATKVLSALAKPIEVRGERVLVEASIGVALYEHPGAFTAEELVRHADAAMYRAKDLGRGNVQVYALDPPESMPEPWATEVAARRALQRGEFRLHYQPVVELESNRTHAYEALLRWEHPQWGLVAASRFLPSLQDSEFALPVGHWILHSACDRMKRWRESASEAPRLAMNVFPRPFHAKGFVDAVERALEAAGIPPEGLELELTQGLLMRDPEGAGATLARLKDLGFRLTMDQFGRDTSMLGCLTMFPLDAVKIDRTLLARIDGDPRSETLVGGIIDLAHRLGLEAVAVGVETEQQLEALLRLGCDLAQGYLLGAPEPRG
jgi:diguanylate cyclase (GGDEF)-like protein